MRIKDVCKEKGITVSQLAERMGIRQESLSRAINGNPTLETLEKMASALEVNIAELFERPQRSELSCPNCGAKLELRVKE